MILTNCSTNLVKHTEKPLIERFFFFYIYYMVVKRYSDFLGESRFNPISRDLTRFKENGAEIKHKVIYDNSGIGYNLWYTIGDKSRDTIMRYTGRHAFDLGGYSPSSADIFLYSPGNFYSVVKTNRDDIVPSEVIKQSSVFLLAKSDGDTAYFANREFVKKGDDGEPDVSYHHIGAVTIRDGVVSIKNI